MIPEEKSLQRQNLIAFHRKMDLIAYASIFKVLWYLFLVQQEKHDIFFLYQNTISVHVNYEAINKVIQLKTLTN